MMKIAPLAVLALLFCLTGRAAYIAPAAFYYGSAYGFSGSGIAVTNIRSANLAAGTTDIFTVPAGQRLFINAILASGTNLTATTAYSAIKTNGAYYRYSATITVVTNSVTSIGPGLINFFAEPGEAVAVVTTLAGVNMTVSGLLFSTNIPAYSPRIMALATTNITLYTCPAGKVAVSMTLPAATIGAPFLQGTYFNDSGSSRTIAVYVVPSGGAANSTTIALTRAVADKALFGMTFGPLFPGESIVMNSDAATATQWTALVLTEIPFP